MLSQWNDKIVHSSADASPPSFLEEGFGTVRRGVQGLLSEYSSVTESFNTKVSTGYEHSMRKKFLFAISLIYW